MVRNKSVEPATLTEVREYFAENPKKLPEGVTIGSRGRISVAVREAYTAATKRPVV